MIHIDMEKIEILKRIIKEAVSEEISGDVRRPQSQLISDWRQNFYIAGRSEIISHHFPFDPKVGEVWKIYTKGYSGEGEKITVKIDQVTYDWRGYEYETWFLEIDIECHLIGNEKIE